MANVRFAGGRTQTREFRSEKKGSQTQNRGRRVEKSSNLSEGRRLLSQPFFFPLARKERSNKGGERKKCQGEGHQPYNEIRESLMRERIGKSSLHGESMEAGSMKIAWNGQRKKYSGRISKQRRVEGGVLGGKAMTTRCPLEERSRRRVHEKGTDCLKNENTEARKKKILSSKEIINWSRVREKKIVICGRRKKRET